MPKKHHIPRTTAGKVVTAAVVISTFLLSHASLASATTNNFLNASDLTTCPDVEVIFAHGAVVTVSESQDAKAWHEAFQAQNLDSSGLNVDYYYLGEKSYDGAQYTGADIGTSSLSEIKNILETYFSAGESGVFQDSVKAGVTEMAGRIKAVRAKCPNTKFVFGGYSEGAYVLHSFFQDQAKPLGLTAQNVVYIATFGDPKLYLPEGEGTNPPACQNKAFSGYRVYAPNCRAHSGILGASTPDYFPTAYLENTGLWCTKQDAMCSNYFDIFNLSHLIDDHLAYADQEPYPYHQASILVRQKLSALYPEKVEASTETVHSPARDTAILIDTTGSMAKTINKYKTEALKIAKTTVESGGRIALFEYRDLSADGKEYAPKELCDFSCTYEEFADQIANLKASGGGDTPESALSASLGAMNKLSWQKGATKSIVLLTDATYHDADFDGTTLSDVVKRSLEIDPVNFYVVAPSSILSSYANLTTQTNGNTFSLSSEDIELSSETLLGRPDLNFASESYSFTTSEVATFLLDTHAKDVDHFEWDLDLDGVFEITTTTPSISSLYNAPTSGFVQARVVTTSGLSSSASAVLTVTADQDLGEAPVLSSLTVKPEGDTAKITYEKSDSTAAVIIFIDDSAIGLTAETEFTITDLDSGSHTIALAPVSTTGLRGQTLSKTFTTGTTETAKITKTSRTATKSTTSTLPKAPDTSALR